VLAESGAIVEYLLERHGNGRLAPARGTNEHVRYLHWMHFAEGTIMLHLVARLCRPVPQRCPSANLTG
jgi:glutathione S-transferase